MPHTKPRTHEQYWLLCPKNTTSGLAAALLHLRARLDGLPVTTQFVNPVSRPLIIPPQDAIIYLSSGYKEEVAADEYPFSEFDLDKRGAGRVIYYDDLSDLLNHLQLSNHIAARELVHAEAPRTLTNHAILLARLYMQLGHDDFAAYIAHRLFTQPHYGYRILEDQEALQALMDADEMIIHPEAFTHVHLP